MTTVQMNNIIDNFIIRLIILFSPSYWIMNNSYSELWDVQLNKLMKDNKFSNLKRYTVTLGEHEIWIANHPYASFTGDLGGRDNRPSRMTIYKANKKLIKDLFNDNCTD